MALGEFRLRTPQVDVFGSPALRKCSRVWIKEDNGWKRGCSSDLWDLLYVHAPRGSLERVVAKIAGDSARAVVTLPSREIEDATDAPWVQDLKCTTLFDTHLPSAEDFFLDAQ